MEIVLLYSKPKWTARNLMKCSEASSEQRISSDGDQRIRTDQKLSHKCLWSSVNYIELDYVIYTEVSWIILIYFLYRLYENLWILCIYLQCIGVQESSKLKPPLIFHLVHSRKWHWAMQKRGHMLWSSVSYIKLGSVSYIEWSWIILTYYLYRFNMLM